jgi:hypothetical protein
MAWPFRLAGSEAASRNRSGYDSGVTMYSIYALYCLSCLLAWITHHIHFELLVDQVEIEMLKIEVSPDPRKRVLMLVAIRILYEEPRLRPTTGVLPKWRALDSGGLLETAVGFHHSASYFRAS